MQMRSFIFIISAISSIVALWVQADLCFSESSSPSTPSQLAVQTGKLPDGRAFRVDGSGQKITDYLAELEVSVQEMRNTIASLEDELKQCEAKTERVKEDFSIKTPPQPQQNSPRVASPAECAHLTIPLNQKIDRMEQLEQLARLSKNNDCNQATPPKGEPERTTAAICDIAKIEKPYQDRIAELESARNNLTISVENLSKKLAAISQPLQTRIAELEVANERLTTELLEASNALASVKTTAQTIGRNESDPKNNSQGTARAKLVNISETPATQQPTWSSEEELQGVKRSFAQEITNISQLVSQRKSALDRQKEISPQIAISISPLQTKVGHSLDDLRIKIDSNFSKTEAKNIEYEIKELRIILENDIQILKGLSNVRR